MRGHPQTCGFASSCIIRLLRHVIFHFKQRNILISMIPLVPAKGLVLQSDNFFWQRIYINIMEIPNTPKFFKLTIFSFDKEYILISGRYQYTQPLQQRIVLLAVRMHTAKKKNYKKEKSRYSDLFLRTVVLIPSRQHQKSSSSKSDASKKETVHTLCRRPVIDLRFSP
jgi:hypothetical protein